MTLSEKPLLKAHALLGPSSAAMWAYCTPSARLNEQVEETSSDAADRGSFGHKMIEHCLRDETNVADLIGRPEWEGNKYFTQELRDDSQFCIDYARQLLAEVRETCTDAYLGIEERLDLTEWIPEGFGTGDIVIVADGTLISLDWKMGRLKVVATDNPQPRAYALGAWRKFSHLYDVEHVRMIIVQPALDHIDEETLPIADLLAWGEWLKGRAALAWEGKGEFAPSDKSCKWCKVKAICRARAEANLALAQETFKPIELLTLDEIAALLPRLPDLQAWAKDVEAYAFNQALNGGSVPGWKLVAGRSNRRIEDADELARRLLSGGYDEQQIYDRSLLTLTALEKVVGAKKFAEMAGDLVSKPSGKPTLVPASDKRAEFNTEPCGSAFTPI